MDPQVRILPEAENNMLQDLIEVMLSVCKKKLQYTKVSLASVTFLPYITYFADSQVSSHINFYFLVPVQLKYEI